MRREHQLNLRLTETELARLRALAAHYGLTVSETVRRVVRSASEEMVVAWSEDPASRPAKRP